jgi:hypothetical protein
MFAILIKIIEQNLVVKVLLKDVKAIDYYKRVESAHDNLKMNMSRSVAGMNNFFEAFNNGGRGSA